MTSKTHKTRNSAVPSFSHSFEGLLRSNGHGYLDVKKNSFSVGLLFSTVFKGEISPFGKMEMKMTEVAGSFLKSFPTIFEGEVFDNGLFQLSTIETDWEVLAEGIAMSMIGSVLTDGSMTKRFFTNKDSLTRIREEYKRDIEKKTDNNEYRK